MTPDEARRRAGADAPLGEPIRQYRVAVAPDGTLLAGAGITERFKLMADHIDAIPLPIAVLGRISGMIPGRSHDPVGRAAPAWHAPGRADAMRASCGTRSASNGTTGPPTSSPCLIHVAP